MSAPMIDLAPGHKIGLIVENPVLLAPAKHRVRILQ